MTSSLFDKLFLNSADRPAFLNAVFLNFIGNESDRISSIFDLKNEAVLSVLCDHSQIQDSFRFRSHRRSKLLAAHLINDQGELNHAELHAVIQEMEKKGFIFYPQNFDEGAITQRFIQILKKLRDDESFYKSIKKFRMPLCHHKAEKFVSEAMGLPNAHTLTDGDLRRAVLSACLTVLRQNVGSCFATAPAILILQEKIEYFIHDLYELLMTGKMHRTFSGKIHEVPLSPTSGMGDLKKSIFLADPSAQIWFSPGLLAALGAAGLIKSSLNLQQQIEAARILILPFLRSRTQMSVEQLLHQLLLTHFNLNDNDIARLQKAEKEMVMRSRQTALSSQPVSNPQKLKNYHLFQEKETLAKETFKGFADNALLKVWEFSIASFSEIKMEFSRWNLYSSLGLDPREMHGIGSMLFTSLEAKLKEANEKTQEYQNEYQLAYEEVRATEVLLRQVSSESEARRLRAEYQSRAHHMQTALSLRDQSSAKAGHYSNFFAFLIKQFDLYFQDYFQEVYDAEMSGLQAHQYDDSPAGFRLIYKHGRKDASAWTIIYTAEEWLACLTDFFRSIEQDLAAAYEWEEGKEEISLLITEIVAFVRTDVFFKSAIERTLRSHGIGAIKNPLDQLDSLEKKPWAYTSGGTMTTLLQVYFRRESLISEDAKDIQSEIELAIFILDSLRNLPPLIYERFFKNPEKGILMQSPTHAFILHPGWDLIKQGWQDNLFTYTWVRDNMLNPGLDFFKRILLSRSQQEHLMQAFAWELGEEAYPILKKNYSYPGDVSISEFRDRFFEAMTLSFKHISSFPTQYMQDKLDSFLYSAFPLTPGQFWKSEVSRLIEPVAGSSLESVLKRLPDRPCEWFTAKSLQDLAKACLLLSRQTAAFELDIHRYIAEKAAENGLARPVSFLFADSNWVSAYFAFTVNPGTERLELWRMDRNGCSAVPMTQWKEWLDGTKKGNWVIYPRPIEYIDLFP